MLINSHVENVFKPILLHWLPELVLYRNGKAIMAYKGNFILIIQWFFYTVIIFGWRQRTRLCLNSLINFLLVLFIFSFHFPLPCFMSSDCPLSFDFLLGSTNVIRGQGLHFPYSFMKCCSQWIRDYSSVYQMAPSTNLFPLHSGNFCPWGNVPGGNKHLLLRPAMCWFPYILNSPL